MLRLFQRVSRRRPCAAPAAAGALFLDVSDERVVHCKRSVHVALREPVLGEGVPVPLLVLWLLPGLLLSRGGLGAPFERPHAIRPPPAQPALLAARAD